MIERRPCPVCDSEGKRKLLYSQRFSAGVLGDGYQVVICERCGASFADGIPSQALLDQYYSEQSKYTYDSRKGLESGFDVQRFERTIRHLEPLLPSRAISILDVGCATGGLLSVFKKKGFTNVLGVDPSPACAKAARQVHEVEVRTCTLNEMTKWTQTFDLILMIGVLEHLREVQNAIKVVRDCLQPQGLLYIAVPDVVGFADCRNAPLQQFSMEHVNFFSSSSLRSLMKNCGFATIQEWNWQTEWRETINEPIASGLFRFSETEGVDMDEVSERALQRYIAVSREQDAVIAKKIDAISKAQNPILIWGTGAFTRRLLATTSLGSANIVGFIDSSITEQSKNLLGKRVLAPSEIRDWPEPIVIGSMAFEREIFRMIKDELGLENIVITLSFDQSSDSEIQS